MYLKVTKLARIVSIAILAAGLAACDIAVNSEGGLHFDVSAKQTDEWTRSYKLASGGRLELINVNGRITAEASDGNTVELRAERTAKAPSDEAARDLLAKIEMREEVGDTKVRIEVRPPRMRSSGLELKWTLKVPKGVAVDLRTVNGGVKMIGLQGDVRARSTNGGITGTGLVATNIDAAVTNGGVEIELANSPSSGSIELDSVNGGLTLTLPTDSKADISARCVNGGISVTGLEVQLQGEQSKRRLEGKLNGGGMRVQMETVNGGVRLTSAKSTT